MKCAQPALTRSRQSGGQNSLIFSNRYCCCSSDSPGGGMMGGRSDLVGFQLLSWRRFISLSGLVTKSLTITMPDLRVKDGAWPLRADCWRGVSKNWAVGTKTSPSCVPTSCTWLTTAELSTTLAMSSRHPIFVRRNACLKSPNHLLVKANHHSPR